MKNSCPYTKILNTHSQNTLLKRVLPLFTLLLLPLAVYAVKKKTPYTANLYKGKKITPQSLLTLAPKMPQTLQTKVNCFMKEHGSFVKNLVELPRPLSLKKFKQKVRKNNQLINELRKKKKGEDIGDSNYMLRFNNYPSFIVTLNELRSRAAHLAYSTNQGNVLDPSFNRENLNYTDLGNETSRTHCGRVGYYLLAKQIAQKNRFKFVKTPPTYLQHIPGTPTTLSDEHYITLQKWIPGLKEINSFTREGQKRLFENMPDEAFKELYLISKAALWNLPNHLAIDQQAFKQSQPPYYYNLNLEGPFNVKSKDCLLNDPKKYTEDTRDTFERWANRLKNNPQKLKLLKQLEREDTDLQPLFNKYGHPSYNPRYLHRRFGDLGSVE